MDLTNLIAAVLGGGLFLGIAALIKAFSEGREKKSLQEALEAKTPAEVESVSIATMTKALESAQTRITSLEREREIDKQYYQQRITELTEQLRNVRVELVEMEVKLAGLLAETHHSIDGPKP
jgi:hypothetical protein